MNISNHSVVSIHYTLKDDQNKVLDSSSGSDPLMYIHGTGNIVPGLEQALEGRKVGDQFKVSIPPQEGYGPRDEKRVQSVQKKEFPNAEQVEVGMQFQVNTDNGPMVFTVVEVKDSEIVVDGNHPLAGATLHFDVEVTEVRKATQEELDHGHAHGAGGHHH